MSRWLGDEGDEIDEGPSFNAMFILACFGQCGFDIA